MILDFLRRNKKSISQVLPTEPLPTEVLETNKKLSDCMIWQLMEDYYQQGVDAWQIVPFHATSNCYIAKSYAELTINFLLDYLPHLDINEPVYVLEMAAGTGNLSFHLVRELLQQKEKFSALRDIQIKYVMADFAETTLEAWKKQPQLMEYVQAGVLDFALFYPEDETQLFLQHAQHVISAKEIKNPLLAIANYFFDSLRQDLFHIENHQLHETLIDVVRTLDPATAEKPVSLEQLSLIKHHHEITGPYYADEKLNTILNNYAEHFEDASIILPVAAFQVIRNLEVLSNNNLVLISSDKGFSNIDFMEGQNDHSFAPHGGAFSYMVNYHAIGQYFTNQGGYTLETRERDYMLTTTLNIKLKTQAQAFEHLSYYFEQYFKTTNLVNNLSSGIEALRVASDLNPQALIRASFSLIRMSNYDPGIFWFIGERLCRVIDQLSYSQKAILLEMIEKVHQHYYQLPLSYNALGWIGAIYYELGHLERARETFLQSVEIYGEASNTGVIYYLGLTYEKTEQLDAALYYLDTTLKVNPTAKFVNEDIARIQKKKSQLAQPKAA